MHNPILNAGSTMKCTDSAMFHMALLDFLERDSLLTICSNELIASMLAVVLMLSLRDTVSVGVYLDQPLPVEALL